MKWFLLRFFPTKAIGFLSRNAKSVWFVLSLDCKGSAELCSKRLDQKLSLAERVAVRAHLLICRKSRRLNGQLVKLHHLLIHGKAESRLESLDQKAKKRIQNAVKRAIEKKNL